MTQLLQLLLCSIALFYLPAGAVAAPPDCRHKPQVCLESLQALTVQGLRERDYGSQFQLLEALANSGTQAFMASYLSDGMRLYSRVDLPSSAPGASGHPVVILAPGWISREEARNWDFGAGNSTLGTVRQALVNAGFAVVTAGYRGRGTVRDVPAQGMEFRDAWGNGSYLSPMFYAIDILNLVAGLESLQRAAWSDWRLEPVRLDPARVSLWGHSQGGDVATTALAVMGNNRQFPQRLLAASIWCGNIPDRFTQANTFGPMGSTLQAFMSGDGSWTGSAVGRDGEINPEFVHPWPADWIGTVDTNSAQWTWQAQQWSTPGVADALREKYGEMYNALNRYVGNISGASFSLHKDDNGRSRVQHDPRVEEMMPLVGAYHQAGLIDVPLALHISDRDYYSIPEWNQTLARRIDAAGGQARVYIYPGTNHALRRSEHSWFSPPGTEDGVERALARDIRLYRGEGLRD